VNNFNQLYKKSRHATIVIDKVEEREKEEVSESGKLENRTIEVIHYKLLIDGKVEELIENAYV
jgi:hypothetical protein